MGKRGRHGHAADAASSGGGRSSSGNSWTPASVQALCDQGQAYTSLQESFQCPTRHLEELRAASPYDLKNLVAIFKEGLGLRTLHTGIDAPGTSLIWIQQALAQLGLLDMSTAQGLVLLSSSEVEEKCRTLLGTFNGCGYGDPCQFGNIMEKWGPDVCSRLEEIDMQFDEEVDALAIERLPKKKLKTVCKTSVKGGSQRCTSICWRTPWPETQSPFAMPMAVAVGVCRRRSVR